MDVLKAIKTRKSTRDFKDTPVPEAIIREILIAASQAPSAMNTQPWEFTVVTGNVLDKIKKTFVTKIKAGERNKSEHSVEGWPKESVYRNRQVELAKGLFNLMGIRREDSEERTKWIERGFRFFNAPVAVIVTVDRMLAEGTPIFDVGAATQNLCLAAHHYGLGTCIEEQGVMFPQVLRDECKIPESKRIIISVALGYPNNDFPANALKTNREPVDNITTWIGF
ncbi:MAG: nitroreductase [Desulfotalea sp.]